jgi:ketosteroid isomerase-like protein
MNRLSAGVVSLLLLAGATLPARAQQPAASPLPPVALPAALDRVLRDYERAWQARDPAALADLFAEDGFVLASGRPPVRGRAAIRAAYADGGGPLALRALAYATEGSTGYIVGAYGPGAGHPDTGKFVLALRRGAGDRWVIAADIDNGNQRGPRPPSAAVTPSDAKVLFVCEHGSAKSLIASEWFNRLAQERGLPMRSVSRGLTPDDAIPPVIAQHLRGDGFDVSGMTPRRLEEPDGAGAVRIVGIGVDAAALGKVGAAPVEIWTDIPPVSTGYAASRDAMRRRIDALLEELARTR